MLAFFQFSHGHEHCHQEFATSLRYLCTFAVSSLLFTLHLKYFQSNAPTRQRFILSEHRLQILRSLLDCSRYTLDYNRYQDHLSKEKYFLKRLAIFKVLTQMYSITF